MNIDGLTTGGSLGAALVAAATMLIKYNFRLQIKVIETKTSHTKKAIDRLEALVQSLSDRLDKNEEAESKSRSHLMQRIHMVEKSLLETQAAVVGNAKDLTKAYQQFSQAVSKMVSIHKEIRPDIYRISEIDPGEKERK